MQFKLSVTVASLLFFSASLATPYGGDLAERSTNPIALKRWAEVNSANVNYGSLSLLSLSHRRALYGELSPEQRSALWVAHAENFLTAHPELNSEQQAVVDKAIVRFKTPAGERSRDSDRVLEEEARSVLGWDQAARLLTVLGPAEEGDAQGPQPSEKLMKRMVPQCSCATGDSWCGIFSDCIWNREDCADQADKCGTGWEWDCDGRCD